MRQTLILTGLLTAFCTSIAAANLAGLWSLELMPDFSGNEDTKACSFVQDGETLTLNCGWGPSITGEVKDRGVTFHFQTGDALATFTGELDERETTITGTWHLTDDGRGRPSDGKFVAKKTSDSSRRTPQ